MLTNYTYRYRLYPTGEQKLLIEKHFGCCRFVWNYFLARRKMLYETGRSHSSYAGDNKLLTQFKSGFAFLKEANSQSLQQTLVDLDEAHVRAYTKKLEKRSGHPKFKKKHSTSETKGFCVPQRVSVCTEDSRLYIPKFLEGIPVVLHRLLEGKIKRATVTLNAAGQYHVSILVERVMPVVEAKNAAVGIDLGLKTLAYCSDGTTFENLRLSQKSSAKIASLSRSLHRKKKGSSNYKKAKLRLARAHLKIKNRRQDHLHKVSSRIVRENQAICLETLNVAEMAKNRRLARSVHDAAMGTLSRMVEYKAKLYARQLHRVGAFFPSSKTCSTCGRVNPDLTLADRVWECAQCGAAHDRDKNASTNILVEGLRLAAGMAVNACGGEASAGKREFASKRFRRSTKPPASAVG